MGSEPDFEEDFDEFEPDLPEVLRQQAEITEQASVELSARAELLRRHADRLEQSPSSRNNPEGDSEGELVQPVNFVSDDEEDDDGSGDAEEAEE